MNAETYQNKKITTAGDSNFKTDGIIIGKSNAYQRPFFIVAGSLLALVLVSIVGNYDDQHFKSTKKGIAEGASALVDYQVDTTYLALTKDIFVLGAVSDSDEAGKWCFGSCDCDVDCNCCGIFGCVCGKCTC
mmetsp:Transcript_44692/g.50104  ORF Transcript_44692/g.50104 Transcript_44692/m.50104 type:complete len:132 (-) Transcript_44692:32-427(-)|eukprot:CAMPEP_0170886792 /NCGR_PEP_ID=MMETSP0734-20130129/37062_1 /TAXON_ID=186038 /ORGANISM="Fragilariopsis kerguelensis, Strain L26-C5" /LENGTH=131 /DNA_ID=CAMNT_0011273215 /DNA_START=7 /DNA_END=402 /DNA_ORIENTATION=-